MSEFSSTPLQVRPQTRPLPAKFNLEQQRKLARELLEAFDRNESDALSRIERVLPKKRPIKLADAQHTIAREYGFENWAALKSYIEYQSPSEKSERIKAFHLAIEHGKIDEVERLLRTHAEVRAAINDPIFSFGARAIMQAKANLALVDLLLKFGADINLRSDWWAGSWSILDHTTNEQADALMARGAKLDIHSSIHLDRLDVARSLLESDPEFAHARGGDGCLPLHFARSVDAIDLLQRFNIDLNVIDIDHRSTAAAWLIRDHTNIAKELAKRGATLDIFLAAALGEIDRLRELIRSDPTLLNERTGEGFYGEKPPSSFHIFTWQFGQAQTPLDVAAMFRQQGALDLLLAHATPTQKFVAACAMGDRTTAESILRNQPNLVSTLTTEHQRALPDAAWTGNTRAVQLMLDLGFDPTATGMDNGTALHCAAWIGHAEIVRIILSEPARRQLLINLQEKSHNANAFGWCCHGSLNCRNPRGDYGIVARMLKDAGSEIPTAIEASDEVRNAIQ